MRYLLYLIFTLSFWACNRSSDVEVTLKNDDMFYSDKVEQLPHELVKRVGSWAKVGDECYGIIAVIDDKTKMSALYPIKCKILSFHKNGIKCRTLEDLFPYEKFGCTKMGIKKGDTWLDDEGDLFQTLEEAQNYILDSLKKK